MRPVRQTAGVVPRLRLLRRPAPLRLRLTVAFASVIAIVLTACGGLIYVQFRHYVDTRIDSELADRSVAFRRLAASEVVPRRIVELSGESLTQVYDADGRVIASTRALGARRLLAVAQVVAARRRPLRVTEAGVGVAGDDVRLRGFVLDAPAVAVIGEPLDARERELRRLALLLLTVLPGALGLSSLTGYAVAGAALGPVERMRRRAAQIGDRDEGERLPEPGTGDELDRLASTLNALLDRLHRALSRERRIVGDASHELRTPISVLRTRVDVALRAPDPDIGQLRNVLVEVRADADRLTRLADDLLLLARADQGQLPLRRELAELHDVLEAAAARHRPHAAAQSRSLVIASRVDGAAVVDADPDRLAQVLDNLLTNALRHGLGTVSLELDDAASAFDIVVRDEGPGVAPSVRDRAFDRFSQADDARARGGSGLGLVIARTLAEAHGGSLELLDDGPGAALRVRLPAA